MSQDWLHKEKEGRFDETFYSSRARVGITGFIFDCIAGRQEGQEEEDFDTFDLESGACTGAGAGKTEATILKFNEEPITFALVSSTQIIAAAVNTITSGISGLFSSWKPQRQEPKVVQPQIIKIENESDLFEVIIEGEMEKTLQNIQKSYSHSHVVQDAAISVAIESPKMSDICVSRLDESKSEVVGVALAPPTKIELIEEEISIESEELWHNEPVEDDEDYFEKSLSHSFYAMESYIDFSQDAKIVVQPISKKNSAKKVGVKVHFEPMVELMDAVVNNDKSAVKKILHEGQINVNDRDKLGYTMIHYAASRNHTDLIKYLVDKGADVNGLDLADWTPLHLAAIADNYKACKTLLDLGANFEYPNDEGNIAADLTEDAKVKKLLTDATLKKLAAKKVRALYNWTTDTPEYLNIAKSESLKVLERKDQDWWLLQNEHKQIGLVPRIFVQ